MYVYSLICLNVTLIIGREIAVLSNICVRVEPPPSCLKKIDLYPVIHRRRFTNRSGLNVPFPH